MEISTFDIISIVIAVFKLAVLLASFNTKASHGHCNPTSKKFNNDNVNGNSTNFDIMRETK